MSLQVKYVDAPLGAQEAARFYTSESQSFGQVQQLKTGVGDIPWATLEQGGWSLNGTCRLLPEIPRDLGWWSRELSDANGQFLSPPAIFVAFPRPYSAKGLSFQFWPSSGQWCSELWVGWYQVDTLLAETTAYPDGPVWFLSYPVENFDRVEIRLLSTNTPYQFAKLQQLQIGKATVFSRDEIVSASLLKETDPSLCRLSVDTMTVKIRDRKGRELLPQKDQAMHLYRDGLQVAVQYVTDSIRESKRNYTFRCQSAVGRLEDSFLGGLYKGKSAQSLLREILGEFPFVIAESLESQTVTGYLPVCTRRQALQQLAFAVGGAVTTLGDGRIYLAPLSEQAVSELDYGDVFQGAGLRRETATAAVQITAHSYTPGEEEEILLKGQKVDGENVMFLFSSPHYDYQSPDETCTVIDSGVNWARISGGESVTLTAKKFNHSTAVYTKVNPTATAAEKGNVVSVEKATLIHPGNVSAALERIFAVHSLNDLLTQRVIVSGQEVGQTVRSINPWGTATEGYITAMESEFTDTGHTAHITIRGREVPAL